MDSSSATSITPSTAAKRRETPTLSCAFLRCSLRRSRCCNRPGGICCSWPGVSRAPGSASGSVRPRHPRQRGGQAAAARQDPGKGQCAGTGRSPARATLRARGRESGAGRGGRATRGAEGGRRRTDVCPGVHAGPRCSRRHQGQPGGQRRLPPGFADNAR